VYKRQRISSGNDRDRVDALKAGSDAIMVGIGTVLADNPSLTVKSKKQREDRTRAKKDENPIRIVVDSNAKTPIDAEILCRGSGKRIIAVSKQAIVADVDRLSEKAKIIVCGREEVDLKKLLDSLWQRGVERLMVEGGATLNWSLVSQGLVDEIYIYIGNIIIGGEHAPTLVDGTGFVTDMAKLELLSAEKMDKGIVLQWRVRY